MLGINLYYIAKGIEFSVGGTDDYRVVSTAENKGSETYFNNIY